MASSDCSRRLKYELNKVRLKVALTNNAALVKRPVASLDLYTTTPQAMKLGRGTKKGPRVSLQDAARHKTRFVSLVPRSLRHFSRCLHTTVQHRLEYNLLKKKTLTMRRNLLATRHPSERQANKHASSTPATDSAPCVRHRRGDNVAFRSYRRGGYTAQHSRAP